MRVLAKEFHPMRGHIAPGAIVIFSDGSELTLRSEMGGWSLVNGSGECVVPALRDAYELTSAIIKRDEA